MIFVLFLNFLFYSCFDGHKFVKPVRRACVRGSKFGQDASLTTVFLKKVFFSDSELTCYRVKMFYHTDLYVDTDFLKKICYWVWAVSFQGEF